MNHDATPDRLFESPREPRVGKSSWDKSRLMQGEVWAAWCPGCGKKLTDYDHSREESLQYGRTALATDHKCQR